MRSICMVSYIAKRVCVLLHIILRVFSRLLLYVLSWYYAASFNKVGQNLRIYSKFNRLLGAKCITIGDNVTFLGKSTLTAITEYREYVDSTINLKKYSPSIIIGNNTFISEYNHITAINRIEIGNNVLTGPHVLITDNSHGDYKDILNKVPPTLRPLKSKGAVVIKDNVWIGEGAKIMPGVTVGESSIIGANSVVTKDIPPYSLAVGIPAIIKKRFV